MSLPRGTGISGSMMPQTCWTSGLLNEVENSIPEGYHLCEGIVLRVAVADKLVEDGGVYEVKEEEERINFRAKKGVNEQRWWK